MTEKIKVGDSTTMDAYVARPKDAGPHAGVVVFEEIFGVNAHVRSVCDRLAAEGFVAIAPDLFHRFAPGLDLGYDERSREQATAIVQQITAAGLVADVEAVVSYARGREDVWGDRVGCVGFCFGGHVAYLAAARTGVRAAASFYGARVATQNYAGGEPTVTETKNVRGRLLCLFGGADKSIPMAEVDVVRDAIRGTGIRGDVIVYHGAGHGFFNEMRPSYDETAAKDAWKRVIAMFREELSAGA